MLLNATSPACAVARKDDILEKKLIISVDKVVDKGSGIVYFRRLRQGDDMECLQFRMDLTREIRLIRALPLLLLPSEDERKVLGFLMEGVWLIGR